MTDTYVFALQADDGFSFSGIGLSVTNTTTRALTTTEASSGVVLTPGLIYNFSLAYMNYTTATPAFAGAGCTIQLLWRRSGGALEIVPREEVPELVEGPSTLLRLRSGRTAGLPRLRRGGGGDERWGVSLPRFSGEVVKTVRSRA